MTQLHPIYRICKNGECITLESLSDTTYEKCYFSKYDFGVPLENPKKIKFVRLNVTDNYNNTEEYFKWLVKNNGYKFM